MPLAQEDARMPRIARELTAIEIKNLSAPGLAAVGGVPGLHLQITPSGARSWVLRVKVGAKRRDMGLGQYPGVPLAHAREKARQARAVIEAGQDPILERERAQSMLRAAQASEKSFKWCADQFMEAHSDSWRNAKHRAQWLSTLTNYAFPKLGALLVRDIKQTHILAVLEPIWRAKNETASRLRGRIETILDWAAVRHYREGENPARWKGRLDKLLPAPGKVQRVEHHEAVPVDDVPAFYAALAQREGMSARALQFTALTAVRSGETRGATWGEFDLEAGVWTIPAERMKAGKEHRVPLSAQALALLNGLPRSDTAAFVFHAPRGGQLSDMALTQVMRRMGMTAVPHGLRSTFRDWAGDRTAYPRDLAEAALAHVVGNAVEAAYRRGTALERRRVMMADWAKFLTAPQPAREGLHKSTANVLGGLMR